MKVVIKFSGKKNDPGDWYDGSCRILVNDKQIANGYNYSECPEDANLGRELHFIYNLPAVLQMAHEAGVRGEPFEIEEIEFAD